MRSNTEVSRAVLGIIGTNVYFLTDREKKACIVIDPADEAETIREHIRREGLNLTAILLTHGHFDHTLAAEELSEMTGAKIYAAREEAEVLEDPRKNCSAMMTAPLSIRADVELEDGQELLLAGFRIRVLLTPGHTKGSCCYFLPDDKILFSGDCLFHTGYGRTDLATGDDIAMLRSVRKLLSELPGDTQVYPGHMSPTSIDFERKYNPLSEEI